MADDTGRSGRSGDEQHHPWAPPGHGVPQDQGQGQGQVQGWGQGQGQGQGWEKSGQERQRSSVSDQPTITAPGGSGGGYGPPPIPPAPGPAPSPYGPPPVEGRQYGGQYYGGHYGGPGPGVHGRGYPGAPSPYGYPGPGGYGWPAAQLPTGKSVAAVVVGIISLVMVASCWGSFLGILTSPVALGLGLSARRGVDRGELGGRGQATAGFVMGIVGTVLSAVIIGIIVLTFTVFQDGTGDSDDPGTGGGGTSVDAGAVDAWVVDCGAARAAADR